jgi:hypothetical protein
VVVGADGIVGDSAFTANAANTGTIQAGWFTDDAANLLDEVILPPDSESWLPPPAPVPLLVPDGSVELVYVFTGGNYRTATLQSSIYIVGDVMLRIDESLNLSNLSILYVSTNATLRLYMNGTNATFGGQGINNPNRATNFLYFGTSQNVTLVVGGNQVTGAFYAPYAHLVLAGETNLWSDFMGACVNRSVYIHNRVRLHFDENLIRNGPWR